MDEASNIDDAEAAQSLRSMAILCRAYFDMVDRALELLRTWQVAGVAEAPALVLPAEVFALCDIDIATEVSVLAEKGWLDAYVPSYDPPLPHEWRNYLQAVAVATPDEQFTIPAERPLPADATVLGVRLYAMAANSLLPQMSDAILARYPSAPGLEWEYVPPYQGVTSIAGVEDVLNSHQRNCLACREEIQAARARIESSCQDALRKAMDSAGRDDPDAGDGGGQLVGMLEDLVTRLGRVETAVSTPSSPVLTVDQAAAMMGQAKATLQKRIYDADRDGVTLDWLVPAEKGKPRLINREKFQQWLLGEPMRRRGRPRKNMG